jgi:hypothetical protein
MAMTIRRLILMISGTTNSITMKLLLLLFLLLLLGPVLKGQTAGGANEGNVSYVTSQNVYVKFGSTEGISAGDTLFTLKDTKMIPVLIVKELSSISCVCVPVSSAKLSVNDKIRVRQRIAKPVENKEIAVVA